MAAKNGKGRDNQRLTDFRISKAGTIYTQIPVGEHVVYIHARDARRERTGVHSEILISCDTTCVASDQFNVTRQEERTRLGKSAYRLMHPDVREGMSEDELRLELDNFCRGLWEQKLKLVPIGDVAGDRSIGPPKMLGPLLIEGGGTIMYGQGGSGKSWVTQIACTSMNAGLHTPFYTPQRKAIYVNLERSEKSMRWRQAQVNAVLGLPDDYAIPMLNQRGASLKDVHERLRKYVQENEIEVGFLDSLTRAGAGDLTRNEVANDIMDALSALFPTFLAIAHTQKESSDPDMPKVYTEYGSNMFRAAADLVLQFHSEELPNRLGVRWTVEKKNVKADPPAPLALVFNDTGELTRVREPYPYEFVELEHKGRPPSMVERITGYIQGCGEATAAQIAKATGMNPGNVSRVLANRREFAFARHGLGSETYYRLADTD